VAEIEEFAAEIKSEGFPHTVLLGMGGSSLAPEVFQRVFGNAPGHPELIVLDSTHPGAVAAIEARIDPQRTLFLVSSKSGTTIEPLSFFHYFWDRVSAHTITPGRNFAAITDPGSFLGGLARERRFRRVFETISDVGGRYSALTHFGLVPAALIGIDIERLLQRAADRMPITRSENSGFLLGAALGELARQGRNKVTYLVSSTLEAFPAWLEQLVAESTGKNGKGILPVANEAAGPPGAYADDRVFVYLELAGDDDTAQAAAVDALEAAGHPVIRLALEDRYDLAGEMYRAEIATAMTGSVLGIHPFNQPDVQIAKELARKAMAGELEGGAIPETPADGGEALSATLAPFLARARPGDYLAVQAFLAPDSTTTERLQEIRHVLRDRLGIATTLGYGPRFLHSTGQLHKGGPATGLFLQIVDHPDPDRAVPGKDYSFGRLVTGQADGDYRALAATGRPVLRICCGDDVAGGLDALAGAIGA
jgi:transaldolase/glucose-6-phosphate isomerase